MVSSTNDDASATVEVSITVGGCSTCVSSYSLNVCFFEPAHVKCLADCEIAGPFSNLEKYSCSTSLPPGTYNAQLTDTGHDGVGMSSIRVYVNNNLAAEVGVAVECSGSEDDDFLWTDSDDGCPVQTIMFVV